MRNKINLLFFTLITTLSISAFAIIEDEEAPFAPMAAALADHIYRFSYTAKSNSNEEIVLNTCSIRNAAPYSTAIANTTHVISKNLETYAFYSEAFSSKPEMNY